MLQFKASLICFNKKQKQETDDRTHLHYGQITNRVHSMPINDVERPPNMIINNRIFLRCYTVAHVLHFQRVVSILFRNVAKKVVTVLSISIFTESVYHSTENGPIFVANGSWSTSAYKSCWG